MPARMRKANMPAAIRQTSSIVSSGMVPTELAALEKTSSGLKILTISLEMWLLVFSSIMPVLVAKQPTPIIISRASI